MMALQAMSVELQFADSLMNVSRDTDFLLYILTTATHVQS